MLGALFVLALTSSPRAIGPEYRVAFTARFYKHRWNDVSYSQVYVCDLRGRHVRGQHKVWVAPGCVGNWKTGKRWPLVEGLVDVTSISLRP